METFQIKTACALHYFFGPYLLPTCQPLATPHHWLPSACLAMATPSRPSGGSTWFKWSFSALAAPQLWTRLCCFLWDGVSGYCRRTEQLKTEKDREIYDQWVDVCRGDPWVPFSKVVESTLAQVSHIWRWRRYRSKGNQRLWSHHFLMIEG